MSGQAWQPVPGDEPGVADQTRAPGTMENLDRIRDILFGSHRREYAQRFSQLEERLTRETTDVKTDIRRRLEALEAHNRQEVEALSDRLATERRARDEAGERIFRELTQFIKALEIRLLQSDEQVTKDLREMRQLTLERYQSFAAEISQTISAAESAHKLRLEELRGSSVDRFALADLMAEIALRLRGDFRIPGVESPRDAGAPI